MWQQDLSAPLQTHSYLFIEYMFLTSSFFALLLFLLVVIYFLGKIVNNLCHVKVCL